MISPLFLTNYFQDITNQIPNKYFLNIPLKDYEIFSINVYFYDNYYNLFSRKNNLNIFDNLNNNILDNLKYFIKLIKNDNYNKEGIILAYAYIAYLCLIKSNINLNDLENYYLLNNKITKVKYNYSYYDLRLPYYLVLDKISRHILNYPDIKTYLKKASYSCYKYYAYTFKLNKLKVITLKILSKIYHKNYLPKSNKFINLDKEYNDIISLAIKIINSFNDLLYFNKEKTLIELINNF